MASQSCPQTPAGQMYGWTDTGHASDSIFCPMLCVALDGQKPHTVEPSKKLPAAERVPGHGRLCQRQRGHCHHFSLSAICLLLHATHTHNINHTNANFLTTPAILYLI